MRLIKLSHSTVSSSVECWNSARQSRFTEDLRTRKQRKWRDTSIGIVTVSLCLSWCKAKMQNDNDFQHSATFFSLPGYHSSSDNVTTKSISRKLKRTFSEVLKDTELTRCSRLLWEKRLIAKSLDWGRIFAKHTFSKEKWQKWMRHFKKRISWDESIDNHPSLWNLAETKINK